ncbi:hypothetical protein [Cupriavidus campinensis]
MSSEYIRNNARIRTSVGMRLRVTAHEKQIIRQELERRVRAAIPYNMLTNSCSSNVAEVLGKIGILARDPRFPAPITPAEVRAAISKSNRLTEQRLYRQGSFGETSGDK